MDIQETAEVFGKGGIREDVPDPRDFEWGKDVGSAAVPFDWNEGFDIEKVLSAKLGVDFKLPVKNQGYSSSCGGQAWGYLGQALDILNDGTSEEKSAKFIYNQTHVGTGGSGGRENCAIFINKGMGNEVDCPSYENGLPPSEEFMVKTNDIPPVAFTNALKDLGLAYANVLTRNVEDIATAVRDNYGCILGVTGVNNGTWRDAHPQPPTTFVNSWNHWLYCGKLRIRNGKKEFGVLNSWGSKVGEHGWQWLSEEYVTKFILGYPIIFSVWTMVAKKDVVIPPPLPTFQFTKTLKFGMSDFEVKKLQEFLGVNNTGYFGYITLNKVKNFQTAHQLKADGVVGIMTRAILNSLL
jgi:peptidoglycan hydrolase-like protein with peptidoglycan-binding domain